MGSITVLNKYVCDDPNAIYIGRPSPLGNPFVLTRYGRAESIARYETWLELQIEMGVVPVLEALDEIAIRLIETGAVNLKCFCKPKACHGDIIANVVLKRLKETELESCGNLYMRA